MLNRGEMLYAAKRKLWRMQGNPPAHFIHIGKTGGTAIKDALSTVVRSDYDIVIHPHRTKLPDVPKGEKFFFCLRDPISRFVSAFYARQREDRPRYNSPWQPSERVAFEAFSSPEELAAALPESEEACDAMNGIQHIRASYWKWLISPEYLRARLDDIIFIGFQESLTEDFGQLAQRLGVNAALPNDQTKAHRSPSGLDRSLSDRAVENLRWWYAKDYECLDVCKELQSELISRGTNSAAEASRQA